VFPAGKHRFAGIVRILALGSVDMPSDRFLRAANTVHRVVLKITGGRVGWKGAGMPVLELTTVGRKSGRPHSVLLTSPLSDDGAIVIVASRGGDDHHPAWFLNLQANPDVEVALAGAAKQPMRARVASPDERARLWPRVVAAYKGYGGYQEKTSREIPLVLLAPAG
jgi:deazaflavin-dependent oxidoreductase (nitroreductase family)